MHTAAYSQKLSIEIYNKTGITLDSVQLDSVYIGRILNDSSAIVKDLNEFQLTGSWPLLRIKAVDTSGKLLIRLAECGTKAVTVKEGHHAFDIKLNTAGLNPHLELLPHR